MILKPASHFLATKVSLLLLINILNKINDATLEIGSPLATLDTIICFQKYFYKVIPEAFAQL